MQDFFSDRVLRSFFAFALGVAFVVLQLASDETHHILTAMGVAWCIAALYWTVKEVKADWKKP